MDTGVLADCGVDVTTEAAVIMVPDGVLGSGSCRCPLNLQRTDGKLRSHAGTCIDIQLAIRNRYGKGIRRIIADQKEQLRHRIGTCKSLAHRCL